MKYKITVSQIMEWNGMATKDVRIGQRLTIYYDREISPYFFVVDELAMK